MSGGGGDGPKKCGLAELIVFLAALVFGTLCSIMSKNMMRLTGEGISGEIEVFEKPIFQTFGMFLGMLFALLMHWVVLALKIPFPGYTHGKTTASSSAKDEEKGETSRLLKKQQQNETDEGPPETPVWMYYFLAIPALFDLGATALCMMGLRYIPVSIYQLLRGSGKLNSCRFLNIVNSAFESRTMNANFAIFAPDEPPPHNDFEILACSDFCPNDDNSLDWMDSRHNNHR